MNLNIFVSKTCFIYCKGCYSYSREEKCVSELSTEKICEFLKYAYNHGIKQVTLCGGDPLAREDIMNLLKRIKDIGIKISIDTIGTPLIRDIKIKNKLIKKIDVKEVSKYVDEIGIPIDGSNNEIIRLFRPTTTDIFKEQLTICNILKNNKIKTCINTVLHKGNIGDFKNLANVIKNLDGVYKWQIFQFAPLGKFGFLNRKAFEISEEEFDTFKNQVLKEIGATDKKIEFKKCKDRVKHYMLIDNSGNAWVPEFEKIITNKDFKLTADRLIIGNIQYENDWPKICEFLKTVPNKTKGE